MKIIKYTKQKNNQYQVDFDSESLLLYDEIIIQHELLLKKTIKEEELKALKEENLSLKGYYLALKYLNTKMRTKFEVREYLKKEDMPDSYINSSLQRLENQGYIDDEKYAQFYINDSVKFSKDGPMKIKQKLKKIGIKEEIVKMYLAQIPIEVWKDKIKKIIEKRVETNHSYSMLNLKNKLISYLYTKGYPTEMTSLMIEKIDMPTNIAILKKEKEKIERKLSRKYDGNTLSYQVKMKLIQKGFKKEDIEKIL